MCISDVVAKNTGNTLIFTFWHVYSPCIFCSTLHLLRNVILCSKIEKSASPLRPPLKTRDSMRSSMSCSICPGISISCIMFWQKSARLCFTYVVRVSLVCLQICFVVQIIFSSPDWDITNCIAIRSWVANNCKLSSLTSTILCITICHQHNSWPTISYPSQNPHAHYLKSPHAHYLHAPVHLIFMHYGNSYLWYYF